MQTDRNALTEGVIWKKLLFFALPILLGNIFQQMYNTADALIVGRFLDEAALAAVTSSGSLIFMMVGFFNGIAMGAGAYPWRYIPTWPLAWWQAWSSRYWAWPLPPPFYAG